jgi:hypothetical protein
MFFGPVRVALDSIVLSIRGCFSARKARFAEAGPLQELKARLEGTQTDEEAGLMQISVDLTKIDRNREYLTEKTAIALGTNDVVLFSSTLPLAVDDMVLLSNPGSLFEMNAIVIGMLNLDGQKAVAARIVRPSDNTN